VRKDIHPKYYPEAKVTCACGNTWTTGSTSPEIHTDVCSKCHPFFTGEQRIVDTAGQVERFRRRLAMVEKVSETTAKSPAAAEEAAPGQKQGVKAKPVSRKASKQAATEKTAEA
jgi:large subunit ribosomal protein L31